MVVIEWFLKGGLIMWPILLLSIVAVAIIIEKYILLNNVQKTMNAFWDKVNIVIKQNDIKGAINLCINDKSPASQIFYQGLRKIKFGHDRVKEAMEAAGREEVYKMQRGMTLLATIAGVAPMLGFLGTVTGLSSAFMVIESLQGAVSPGDLAGGIYQALITTIFGLFVGIPCLIFYNLLNMKMKRIILKMEYDASEILDLLQEQQITNQ